MNKINNRDERDDAAATIAIVDDDESVRLALKSLFRSMGFKALDFPSGEDFLKADGPRDTGCLILDVRMSGMDNGLELQRRLAAGACRIPIVFIAGGADEATRARTETGRHRFFVQTLHRPGVAGCGGCGVRGRRRKKIEASTRSFGECNVQSKSK